MKIIIISTLFFNHARCEYTTRSRLTVSVSSSIEIPINTVPWKFETEQKPSSLLTTSECFASKAEQRNGNAQMGRLMPPIASSFLSFWHNCSNLRLTTSFLAHWISLYRVSLDIFGTHFNNLLKISPSLAVALLAVGEKFATSTMIAPTTLK